MAEHILKYQDHLLFQQFPEAGKKLSPHVKQRKYNKHDVIAYHGDLARYFWLVLDGWLKLSRQTPNGNETITGLCTTGDIIGEASLFPYANYPYTIEVLTENAVIACIPADIIRDTVKTESTLSAHIMALLGERANKSQLKVEHMSTLSATQRLGCFLLGLCHTKHDNHKIHLPVEKLLIASYLGMKPETLSRSFQQLKEIGVEIKNADITINNIKKLREFVCESCSESGMCEAEENVNQQAHAPKQI